MFAYKLLGAIAVASMATTPILAAASVSQYNPAAALALPSAGEVRASSHGGKRNGVGPVPLLPVLLGITIGGLGIAAAAGAFDSKKPVSQ
ncbi:hypothetical protein [Sphingomonas sp. MMS24-J13]|uniref:hypothetical protein n=1 Tax=Sphingomonas sp. MMS24-J13 TaxID=3238686 RepID=UPI00384A9835